MTAAIQDDLFAFLAVCDVLHPRPVHTRTEEVSTMQPGPKSPRLPLAVRRTGPIHDTPAILHAVMTAPLPSRQTDRQHIEAAIRAAAAEHDGYVTAAWVRPHITRDVLPQMVGAVMGNGGLLEPTGRIERNEGGNGNALKWSPVWRLIDTRKH